MTAQVHDAVRHRAREHAVAGCSGSALFDPQEHGLTPVATCTACWRGFQCFYEINKGVLYLRGLSIGLDEDASESIERAGGPRLFGKLPEYSGSLLPYFYDDLRWRVPFTGGLLLGSGFIRELYVHMGFQEAWKYRKVLELTLEDGQVIEDVDRSDQVAALRRRLSSQELRPEDEAAQEEIQKAIAECFSRDYTY